MRSVSNDFSNTEIFQQCAALQHTFEPEDEKRNALKDAQVAYWCAFIQQINEDWKTVTDNPNYLAPDVLETIFILTKVPQVWALIENSPAVCHMLWIHQGLEEEARNSPLEWMPTSPLPSPGRFGSLLEQRTHSGSYVSPYVPRTQAKFMGSPLGTPKDKYSMVDKVVLHHCQIVQKCLNGNLKESEFDENEIEYWTQFIEQLNDDWADITKNPHFLDPEVLETLFQLTACPEIWELIQKSPGVCAMLWIRQGLYAEKSSEIDSASCVSPVTMRFQLPRTPDFRRQLPSPFSTPSKASPCPRQSLSRLRESHRVIQSHLSKPSDAVSASGYSWTTVAISSIVSCVFGGLITHLYDRSGQGY